MNEKLAYYKGGLDRGLVGRYWRLMATSPPARVLDVGCGTGDFGRTAPDGVRVFGVDHDPGAVRRAMAHEEAQVVDLERAPLPFADASFEAVLAKDILEHVSQPTRLLAEIRRVLVPGGRLLVSLPMEYPWVVWDDYTHHRGFTKRALHTMLADADFADIRVWPMGAIPGAGRLGLVDQLPRLLSLPLMRPLFGRSWEALAIRP